MSEFTPNQEAVRRISAHLLGEDMRNVKAAIESFPNGYTVLPPSESTQVDESGSSEPSAPIVMRVHYGDSEAYYRAYNEGFDDGARDALLGIPDGLYEGANRYDTDDQHVLHVWADGQSFDLTAPKAGEARSASAQAVAPGLDVDAIWEHVRLDHGCTHANVFAAAYAATDPEVFNQHPDIEHLAALPAAPSVSRTPSCPRQLGVPHECRRCGTEWAEAAASASPTVSDSVTTARASAQAVAPDAKEGRS